MCEHGTTVPMPINGRVRDIDSCLALIVATLNTIPKLETVACCCGHGKMVGSIALADGRELLIASDFEQARWIESLIKQDDDDDPAPLTPSGGPTK